MWHCIPKGKAFGLGKPNPPPWTVGMALTCRQPMLAVSRRSHEKPQTQIRPAAKPPRSAQNAPLGNVAAGRAFRLDPMASNTSKQCCRYDQRLDEAPAAAAQKLRSIHAASSPLRHGRWSPGAESIVCADGHCPTAPTSDSGPWDLAFERFGGPRAANACQAGMPTLKIPDE